MAIEVTDEMRAAVRSRMGVPDGAEMDPWMEPAIADVLVIVERDYRVTKRPVKRLCDAEGPGDARCARSPHDAGLHAASGVSGVTDLVTWH